MLKRGNVERKKEEDDSGQLKVNSIKELVRMC